MEPLTTPTVPTASTSSIIPTVTEQTFEAEVLQAKVPVLVDFSTAWCPPCARLKPILQEMARTSGGRFKVVMIDGDDSAALASRLRVRAFPTIVAFSGGEELARHVGLTRKEKLLSLLDRA